MCNYTDIVICAKLRKKNGAFTDEAKLHSSVYASVLKNFVLVTSLGFGINLDSFFPCNQLTATSYIYQTLGDVEWYVR